MHWTLPHFSTPEQSERWSDLIPLLTWQLWLAHICAADCPLPWQQVSNQALPPGRVANSFAAILARIGTAAADPKPRGKSPGWPEGQPPPVEFFIRLSKKVVLNRKNNCQSQLDQLIFCLDLFSSSTQCS